MKYEDLIPTHNKLRSVKNLQSMIYMMKNDLFRIERAKLLSDPIEILHTEDDKYYLNDGHHRICAAYLYGFSCSVLNFKISNYTYAQINEHNFSCGWVTPYNPITHVRNDNCKWFKEAVLSIKSGESEFAHEWAVNAIYNYGPKAYMEERKVWTIQELLNISLSLTSQL